MRKIAYGVLVASMALASPLSQARAPAEEPTQPAQQGGAGSGGSAGGAGAGGAGAGGAGAGAAGIGLGAGGILGAALPVLATIGVVGIAADQVSEGSNDDDPGDGDETPGTTPVTTPGTTPGTTPTTVTTTTGT